MQGKRTLLMVSSAGKENYSYGLLWILSQWFASLPVFFFPSNWEYDYIYAELEGFFYCMYLMSHKCYHYVYYVVLHLFFLPQQHSIFDSSSVWEPQLSDPSKTNKQNFISYLILPVPLFMCLINSNCNVHPFLLFVITFFQLQTCLPTCPVLPSCMLVSSIINMLSTPLFEQLMKIQSCTNLRPVPLENVTNSNSVADHWELLSVNRVSSQVCMNSAIVFQDHYEKEKSDDIKDLLTKFKII